MRVSSRAIWSKTRLPRKLRRTKSREPLHLRHRVRSVRRIQEAVRVQRDVVLLPHLRHQEEQLLVLHQFRRDLPVRLRVHHVHLRLRDQGSELRRLSRMQVNSHTKSLHHYLGGIEPSVKAHLALHLHLDRQRSLWMLNRPHMPQNSQSHLRSKARDSHQILLRLQHGMQVVCLRLHHQEIP